MEVRSRLGVPHYAIAFRLVGSFTNLPRRSDWCYGAELLRATHRPGLRVLIAGHGNGRARLEQLAGNDLGRRVVLRGAYSPDEVLSHLVAIDVGGLPQTRDPVGALRYTAKPNAHVSAGLPVVTGQVPLAYNVGERWMWRLPGRVPWEDTFMDVLALLMRSISTSVTDDRPPLVPTYSALFDPDIHSRRVVRLISDVLAEAESG